MLTKSLFKVFTSPAVALVMMIMFVIPASAYTLVFRDGRRIEIPEAFTLRELR